ncbi:unnamed protein product, partial [Porites lobata]
MGLSKGETAVCGCHCPRDMAVRMRENFCHSNPCPGENFLCQVGFTDKGHRCVCRDGFEGEDCTDGTTSKAPVTPSVTPETHLGRIFSTDTTTSKAPVTPTATPETQLDTTTSTVIPATQLGRHFPFSRIPTSSTGFPKIKVQGGEARNNTRELETSER